ncbi:MAG: cob(I)yrinic acid a,c-diamide adenosyltransferase, partial [Nitrospinaceae bacterium]|nr:cob(I)yrinic acid a,c-diamide adenosyltransferase [Nitrospinaceae bacterium]
MSEEYKDKAERIKKSYEKRQAAATEEKGLIIVHTGSGKGKSTAAFGMCLRAIHHGLKVGVVQYVKGPIASGEVEIFKSFGEAVEWHRMGEGFSWITQDEELDKKAAEQAWEKSQELMARPEIGMVILDEINVAVRRGQLPLDAVLEALREKREMLHV